MSDLAKTIDDAFEKRSEVSPATKGPVREAVDEALDPEYLAWLRQIHAELVERVKAC